MIACVREFKKYDSEFFNRADTISYLIFFVPWYINVQKKVNFGRKKKHKIVPVQVCVNEKLIFFQSKYRKKEQVLLLFYNQKVQKFTKKNSNKKYMKLFRNFITIRHIFSYFFDISIFSDLLS